VKKPKLVNKHSAESIRFVESLMIEIQTVLCRHGETSTQAERMGRSLALKIARQLESSLIYFSKNTVNQAHARYTLIREDYRDGKTIKQLAGDYNLSDRRIYSILFEIKDAGKSQAANLKAQTMAVTTTGMLMSIGLDPDDARNAASGLISIISAKFGGKTIHIPNERNIRRIIRDIELYRLYKAGKSIAFLAAYFTLSEKDVNNVIDWYPEPRVTTESMSGLTLLKRQILDIAASFREMSSDVTDLLESAARTVARAQEIVTGKATEPS